MTNDDFERFCGMVLQDPELQARLRDDLDEDAFVAQLLRLARERGCEFTADDVADALNLARRTWLERWL